MQKCISDFKLFTSFPNCNLFCKFFLLRNFYFGYAHHVKNGEHCSSPHFRYCTHCVHEIYQCFHTFRNCCLFSTFGLIPKFCCGGSPQANYGKHSINYHFQHCAHYVYEIYSVFELLEIAACFAHFGFLKIWTPLILTMLAMVNVVQIIISNIAHRFRNCCLFCKFLGIFEISTPVRRIMLTMANIV